MIRRLAIGGMGEIFLARQTGVSGFDRLVILKSLLSDLAEEEGFIDQFLDEARVAAMLNHPNVVSIYEVGQWQGIYFIAMEYIRGDNLARLLRAVHNDNGALPMDISMRIGHDAALGLDHAHQAVDPDGRALNIVHRDIGLQNIMVRSDGVTKVVDFGIAHASNRSTRTRTGLVKGKLPYMSPEQVRGEALDGRSDQFSLGIVLWEMATGTRLFRAAGDLNVIRAITTVPIPLPSTVVPEIPVEFEAVIMRMLERSREARFVNCADVAGGLQKIRPTLTAADVQNSVGELVVRVLGDKISESADDLTPSKETPFSGSLGLTGLAGDLDTSDISLASHKIPSRQRRRLWLSLAAAAAFVVGGLAAAWSVGLFQRDAISEGASIVVVGPEGARIRLDGQLWEQNAPTVLTGLSPGPHRLQLEIAEGQTINRQVLLGIDERLEIDEKPPPAAMVLDIREPRRARVIVDGEKWPSLVPTVVTGLSAGPHEVRLQLEDGAVIKKRVSLRPKRAVLIEEPPPARGMVLDIRDPAGATVVIDGTRWRESVPTVVSGLRAGKHEIEFRFPDGPTLRKRVVLVPDESVLIQEPPPVRGKMVIDIREPVGATVVIDGKTLDAVVPTVVTELEPGRHRIRLESDGHEPIVKELNMAEGVAVLMQERAAPSRPILLVSSTPSGATVRTGTRKLGTTPVRIDTLPAGREHTLIVEKSDHQSQILSLTLTPGETRKVDIPLVPIAKNKPVPSRSRPKRAAPKPAEQPKSDGFLTLRTTPWVRVSIDGKPFGSTPLYKVALPPGRHTLHLVNKEFSVDSRRRVTIRSEETTKLSVSLSE